MIEEQKKRVEKNWNEMMENIYKSHIRKMQGDMHKCAADCCDNEIYSKQKVHNCIENCNSSLIKAEIYINEQFQRAADRLKRCIMDCNDKILDKMGPKPSQSKIDRNKEEFKTCATECVNSYCDMLPTLEKAVKEVLSNKQYE
ncbi:protein FAM136A-like [Ptiloglossa arizonensis]|uniref:protein FAM136A-like n=1 Tax=Ptiloglossa arizonensis TaxID=3350558 RepID=UPI003FA0A593